MFGKWYFFYKFIVYFNSPITFSDNLIQAASQQKKK